MGARRVYAPVASIVVSVHDTDPFALAFDIKWIPNTLNIGFPRSGGKIVADWLQKTADSNDIALLNLLARVVNGTVLPS